jgi:hypothetical protein
MSKEIIFKKGIVSGAEVTTSDLILLALNQPPENGFGYKEYQKRARIEKAMQEKQYGLVGSGKEFFVLEDNDFNNLCDIVNHAKWATRDKFLVDFVTEFQK